MENKKISWLTIFQANSGGLSSKRVAGLLGWLVCLILFTLGFWLGKQIPEFGDYVIITSTSLLGVDSIAGMFNKGKQN